MAVMVFVIPSSLCGSSFFQDGEKTDEKYVDNL